MFAISVGDILSSSMIALNTLPMPSDVGEVYPFEGARGTVATCTAQGLTQTFGTLLSLYYTIFLALYFLLTIRYKIRKDLMTTMVEPITFALSVVFVTCPSIAISQRENINPLPFSSPYCGVGSFPYACHKDADVECIRGGSNEFLTGVNGLAFANLYLGILIQGSSMMLIVHAVYKDVISFKLQNPSTSNENMDPYILNRKVVAKQACMYFLAYVANFGFNPVAIAPLFPQGGGQRNSAVFAFALIFKCSQGISNAIIFLYHMVFQFRRCDPSLTFFKALRRSILNPYDFQEEAIVLDTDGVLELNSVMPIHLQQPVEQHPVFPRSLVERFRLEEGVSAASLSAGYPRSEMQNSLGGFNSHQFSISCSQLNGDGLGDSRESLSISYPSKNSAGGSQGGMSMND